VNFHYHDHCLSSIVISNRNLLLLDWMLLFSHLWRIIFDLPLRYACFPLNVGSSGRLYINKINNKSFMCIVTHIVNPPGAERANVFEAHAELPRPLVF